MFRSLETSFTRALQREGITVYDGANKPIPALVRRVRDTRDNGDWLDLYFPFGDAPETGNIIKIKKDNYILALKDHRENEVYARYNAARCNQRLQLIKLTEGQENEFGEIEEIETVYFNSPVYAVTELQGLNKTAIGNAAGGYVTVLMPAVDLNINTTLKMQKFDSESNFDFQTYRITSIDSTDVSKDKNGILHGILRLEVQA